MLKRLASKCIYCGKLQLLKPLSKDGACSSCCKYENKIQLCKEIIKSTWLSTGSTDSKYDPYINTLSSNKEKGARIIEIIDSLDSPDAWYCKSIAYQLQGAKYRQEQIRSSRRLLDSMHRLSDNEFIYISNLLANAYEGEYMFDEAIQMLKLLLQKQKHYSPAHFIIARLMTKQHKLDDAIKYLEDTYEHLKNNPRYHADLLTGETILHYEYESDLRAFPVHIKELKEKKERGYVYRPRKRRKQGTVR